MKDDEIFMAHAIEVAQKGMGRTSPNPTVGALIVQGNEILASGFTQPPGGNHAEIEALNALPDSVDTSLCTIYITLEPCCFFGRTPPCTNAIIASGIKKVVIGILDPNTKVQGKGVALLEEVGLDVKVGCLEKECRRSNSPYFSVRTKNRPWIVAKYAMTLDGKMATLSGDSKWITNEDARAHVGILRDRYDAIMVGTHTLLKDNPRLTARVADGINPIRILVDRKHQAPLNLEALDGKAPTYYFSEEGEKEREAQLKSRGVRCVVAPFDGNGLDLAFLCDFLVKENIMSLLVEGGAGLLGSFFDKHLIDEVWAYIAPKLLGGEGLMPIGGETKEKMSYSRCLHEVRTYHFGDNIAINGLLED